MIDLTEIFNDMADKCMKQGVHIEFKKEPGEEGECMIRFSGPAPLIYHGVCSILKSVAETEAEHMGDPKFKQSYIRFICEQVLNEFEEE